METHLFFLLFCKTLLTVRWHYSWVSHLGAIALLILIYIGSTRYYNNTVIGSQLYLVQFSHSVVSDSLPPHGLQQARPLSITISRSLLKLMSIKLVMPSNHLILCHPLLLPSISPSIRVFSKESVLHIRWPKDWSFSFSISHFNEYSGLISFGIDWLNLLASICQKGSPSR